MNLFGRVAAAFRAGRLAFTGYGGQGGGGSWRLLLPGAQYDYEAAAGDLWRNSTTAACLRWLRTNFAEPTLEVVRPSRDGNMEAVDLEHDVVRLLDRPNPYFDRYTLGAAIVLSAVVDGNVYLYKVRSAAGKVVELWWLPHWCVDPCWPVDGSEWISHYEYRVDGKTLKIAPADLVHFKIGVDPRNDRKGLSDLKAGLRAIVGLNEADTYTAAILRNMGVPGVVLSPGHPDVVMTREDVEEARELWRHRVTSEQRGDPFFATRVLKLERVSLTPEELALDKVPARLEDQVCALIGLPAQAVGLTSGKDHKTYANYGEARRAAYQDALMPLQKALAECLTHQLLRADWPDARASLRWCYDGVAALAENQDALAKRWGELYQKTQVATRAEARAALGLDVFPEDDVFFAEAAGPSSGMTSVVGATDDAQADAQTDAKDDADAKRARAWRRVEAVLDECESRLGLAGRPARNGRLSRLAPLLDLDAGRLGGDGG